MACRHKSMYVWSCLYRSTASSINSGSIRFPRTTDARLVGGVSVRYYSGSSSSSGSTVVYFYCAPSWSRCASISKNGKYHHHDSPSSLLLCGSSVAAVSPPLLLCRHVPISSHTSSLFGGSQKFHLLYLFTSVYVRTSTRIFSR